MANTVSEARRACLTMLLEKWKAEPGHKNSQRAFAEYCGISPGHISQMATGSREIGHAVARRIEKKLMLENGFMDNYIKNEQDPVVEEASTLINQMDSDRRKDSLEYLRSLLKAQLLEEKLKP